MKLGPARAFLFHPTCWKKLVNVVLEYLLLTHFSTLCFVVNNTLQPSFALSPVIAAPCHVPTDLILARPVPSCPIIKQYSLSVLSTICVPRFLRKEGLLTSVIIAVTPSVWICFQLLTGGTRTDEPSAQCVLATSIGSLAHSGNPTREAADASAAGEDGPCRSMCLRRMGFLRELCSGRDLRALCGAFSPTHVLSCTRNRSKERDAIQA
jgi:hypothetical protein